MMRLIASLLFALPLRAQQADALVPVDVQITAVAGPIVTLDKGSESGLRRGDRVRLIGGPAGVRPATLISVEARSARAELDEAGVITTLAVGQRGEVLVPASRALLPQSAPQGDVPAHPPWTQPVSGFDSKGPLLAPARSPAPEERASDWSGRVFTRFEATTDSTGDGTRKYARSWSGVDVRGENPFGLGGRFQFRGDLSYRNSSIDGGSDSETILRVDRLSYALGGHTGDRWRVEFGRFLQQEMPQFGVIDGAELVHPFEGGSRLGVSVGLLPQWLDRRQYDGDSQAALSYNWVSGPERTVELGIGYQKTWHELEADRDFIVSTANAWLGERTSLRGTVGIDYYDAAAEVKEEGFELTEAFVSLDQRFGTSAGASLFGSYFRWPELEREQFPAPPIETLRAQRISRFGTSGWWRFTEGVTARARLQGWEDSVDTGGDAELSFDLRDILVQGGELHVGAFATQGKFSSWTGLRLGWTQWIGATTLRVSWDPAWIEEQDAIGGQARRTQHQLGAVLDARITSATDLSLYVDRQFGDEQDAWIGGFRLQWRF